MHEHVKTCLNTCLECQKGSTSKEKRHFETKHNKKDRQKLNFPTPI